MEGQSQLGRIRAWLAEGRRRVYAGGAAALIVVIALVLAFEPGGTVSISTVQDMIKIRYNTSSVTCAASISGRDVCQVATDKCRGTLLVKPVDDEIFTVVSAKPARLESLEACGNPETLTPQ